MAIGGQSSLPLPRHFRPPRPRPLRCILPHSGGPGGVDCGMNGQREAGETMAVLSLRKGEVLSV
jgi:hypothetical protein